MAYPKFVIFHLCNFQIIFFPHKSTWWITPKLNLQQNNANRDKTFYNKTTKIVQSKIIIWMLINWPQLSVIFDDDDFDHTTILVVYFGWSERSEKKWETLPIRPEPTIAIQTRHHQQNLVLFSAVLLYCTTV